MGFEDLEMFFLSDQPTTCPKCGSRTIIIFDLAHSILGTQIHECPDEECNFIFATEEEEKCILHWANEDSAFINEP